SSRPSAMSTTARSPRTCGPRSRPSSAISARGACSRPAAAHERTGMSEKEPICEDDAFIEGDAGILLGRAHEWAYKNFVPLNASIELTLRCNIRCLHCYNFDRDEPRAACDKPELSTAEILRVMDELRAAGCLFVALTGGEALSHPDLFVFIDH